MDLIKSEISKLNTFNFYDKKLKNLNHYKTDILHNFKNVRNDYQHEDPCRIISIKPSIDDVLNKDIYECENIKLNVNKPTLS